ncbi:hypothetical protein Z517_08771 [Fonsecaea pedrosoi CBS 271.37]|uniref:Uncharacterized protein n=1 Tax=Fonsecaea pedrosoi CBS 271.37 TaxID=1442368 RepID=A0A0D2EXL4_9EURO|nr:uncharacterized protein Z517_08771 [Fonsecaea pedrosoi CBS 271.37]KIW78932.1 hypothetical protein Z517_08771 [Fonsecaea pedrosoi CBS 271.37]
MTRSPPPRGPPPPNRFMRSLQSSARAMPSSKRPRTVNNDIPGNPPYNQASPISSSKKSRESALDANSSPYTLSLMPSAPPPRIRTEENSPPPELSTLIEAAVERTRASGRPYRASNKKMSSGMAHAEQPTVHADDQNVMSDLVGIEAAPKGRTEQKEVPTETRGGSAEERGKSRRKRRNSEGDFEEYIQGVIDRYNNPSQFIGSKKNPGRPLPETFADAGEWDKMLWTWKLNRVAHKDIEKEWERVTGETIGRSNMLVRFCRLKEQFAVSGELNFPVNWLEQYPDDLKYQIMSERKREAKRKEDNLINARAKAMKEIDPLLWKSVQRIYQENYGEVVSCGRLKARWENIVKDTKAMVPKNNEARQKGQSEEGEKESMEKV